MTRCEGYRTVESVLTVPKHAAHPGWVFGAYVYYIVISGGVFAIIGVFASLTVAGIPLGAVLAVLGISYGLYAWMLDQVFSQRGYYTNGAWVCLS